MNKPLFIIFLILSSYCIQTYAQTSLPKDLATRIKNEGYSNSQVESLAQFFTDKLGPRLAGSQMNSRAEELVIAKLEEMGFTNARIEYAADFPQGGWDNQMNYVAMTYPYYCSFSANPKAWSGSTNGLVKGECILFDVKNIDELKKYKGKLSNKIVIMPTNKKYQINFKPSASRYTNEELTILQKGEQLNNQFKNSQHNSTFVKRLSSYIRNTTIRSFLNKENALAIVVGSGTLNNPISTRVNYKTGNPEPIPEIIISMENHGRMARMLAKGEKVEMELNIKNIFTNNHTINNIIAEIPGTDPKLKHEVILLGAHLDSWHGGTGAADNASGCVVMIEALRIIKELGIQPKRTIRIALWGGEEQGRRGSRGYAKQYLYDEQKGEVLPNFNNFALYLNMDNGSGQFRGIYLEGNKKAVSYFDVWKKEIDTLGFNTLSTNSIGNTDHQSFAIYGLPAYQFIQDKLEYDRTYHSIMDTYDHLSIEDLKNNAVITAWLSLNAAMDDTKIPVIPINFEKRAKYQHINKYKEIVKGFIYYQIYKKGIDKYLFSKN